MRDYITETQLEEMTEEMINETADLVQIGNLTYEPAEVLKSVDPIAWRTVISEYADSLAEDDEYIIEGYNDSDDDMTDEEIEEYKEERAYRHASTAQE